MQIVYLSVCKCKDNAKKLNKKMKKIWKLKKFFYVAL